MKRLTAILFLAVLVFNFYGYRLMIACLQDRQAVQFEASLDQQDYDEADLISIKTPLNMPYYTGSDSYERAYGSVTINGVAHEYVKRRVYRDTLELLCLPNAGKTALQSAKLNILKLSVDGQPATPEKKSTPSLKNGLPDFFQEIAAVVTAPCAAALAQHLPSPHRYPQPGYASLPEQPPRPASPFTV